MSTDKDQLDDARRRFLEAQADIERLSTEIAQDLCPLHIGDMVTVLDGSREYKGTVGYVTHVSQRAWEGPVVGKEVGWSVGGKRINKGNQAESKHSFHFTSFNATFQNGNWVLKAGGIEEALGLSPLKK
jgi:hypothetical protein